MANGTNFYIIKYARRIENNKHDSLEREIIIFIYFIYGLVYVSFVCGIFLNRKIVQWINIY